MKVFISFVLTVIITITCFQYTYSANNLPFRKRAFEVISEDGSVNKLYEITETYWDYKDTPIDVSADFRSKNITISGEIKIGKINKDGNRLQVISDEYYFDFGRAAFLHETHEASEPMVRRFVVYFPIDSIDLYNFPVGEKIKFRAKFNTVNETYIICTGGEVI